jgi:hypothetical protein
MYAPHTPLTRRSRPARLRATQRGGVTRAAHPLPPDPDDEGSADEPLTYAFDELLLVPATLYKARFRVRLDARAGASSAKGAARKRTLGALSQKPSLQRSGVCVALSQRACAVSHARALTRATPATRA